MEGELDPKGLPTALNGQCPGRKKIGDFSGGFAGGGIAGAFHVVLFFVVLVVFYFV